MSRIIPKVLLVTLIACIAYGSYVLSVDESHMPPLKNGDLIFQTTTAPGAIAIGLASGSLYIHTGVIKLTDEGAVVIHAGYTVEEIPLSKWIDSGLLRRFSVYRHRDVGDQKAAAIIHSAQSHYGKPYDHHFSFDNEAIYCSELEHLLFAAAGISLGEITTIGALNTQNYFVDKLIESRWKTHAPCQLEGYSFEQCYDLIMKQKLVTPAAIANDSRVRQVFTNYW